MASFTFEAMDGGGKSIKGTIEAGSANEAVEKIRSKGMFPTSVKAKGGGGKAAAGGAAGMQRKGGGAIVIGGVSQKQLTTFTRQLSTLLDAGLPIVRSLDLLHEQMKPGVLKNALSTVAEDVNSGSSFSDALAKHPKVFDRLFTNMVKAGEAGGVLDTILSRLADFREKAAKLKKQIISALVYPVAVTTIASLILTGIMIFIVPKFKEIFDDMGMELPGPTLLLLDMADILVQWWYLLPGVPLSVFLIYKGIRISDQGKWWTDWVKMKLPVFGLIVSKGSISRFCRTLGTLIASGVPILEALQIIKGAAGNEVLATAIGDVHNAIKEGEGMAGPMKQTKVFDAMLVNMVDVGEETGEVDKMLIKIADTYDDDVENLVAGMMSLIEPVLIIGMGISIGFIVIALFLPLIDMMGSM